jgi:PilZ domain-containing protein
MKMESTRRETRFPFIASAEVLDADSGTRMNSRISDLSLGGCYVDTINPLPDGTNVQLRIFTETHSFEGPATVVYSHTHLGMGMKFGDVPSQYGEVLRLWLPEATQQPQVAHG